MRFYYGLKHHVTKLLQHGAEIDSIREEEKKSRVKATIPKHDN